MTRALVGRNLRLLLGEEREAKAHHDFYILTKPGAFEGENMTAVDPEVHVGVGVPAQAPTPMRRRRGPSGLHARSPEQTPSGQDEGGQTPWELSHEVSANRVASPVGHPPTRSEIGGLGLRACEAPREIGDAKAQREIGSPAPLGRIGGRGEKIGPRSDPNFDGLMPGLVRLCNGGRTGGGRGKERAEEDRGQHIRRNRRLSRELKA